MICLTFYQCSAVDRDTTKSTYLVRSEDLAKIPTHGPLVVVANHPFGGIEGIVLGDLLQRIRPDTKIVGNYLLERIVPIRDSLISVNPFGQASAIGANARQVRNCLRWLKAGHCLIVFPAGEVSHFRCRRRCITDPPWSAHVAALARLSGADVLPVFFPGRNSHWFTLVGLIHPRLRTAMLGRELLAKQASRIRLYIGRCIAGKRMAAFPDDSALIRWLRFNTYFLANRSVDIPSPWGIFSKHRVGRTTDTYDLVPAVAKGQLAGEVTALPDIDRLVTHRQFCVYVAEGARIPNLLGEIGRLREKTFREVGEGTGKSSDVDLFDRYYRHLILWNAATSEVVGAYRKQSRR